MKEASDAGPLLKAVLALLTVLVLCIVPVTLWAHESRPAFLQIREVSAEQYELVWRVPVFSGVPLPVFLGFPDGIRDLQEPVTQRLKDSVLERRTVEAKGGLGGKAVHFLGLEGTIADVLVEVDWLSGEKSTTIVRASQPAYQIARQQSSWDVVRAYTRLGIEHILSGIDHLLFILALILLVPDKWRLIKTVTAFTAAHSITLGLAALGYVHVPSRPVEAVIALSIAFVASEAVRAHKGLTDAAQRAPWVLAFIFGLLHGLGFAGALSEIGLPEGHIPEALLFFNVGVEIGQLLFIVAALTVLSAVRRLKISWPNWASNAPAYLIGGVAMLWVLERTVGV